MKRLLRTLLNAKTSPVLVAVFIIINGAIIAYAVNTAPQIATTIVILVTSVLALFIFAITFISINDRVRISPLVNQQYYVYEVLQSKLEWEITTVDGSLAKLTKVRKIKFLDSHISTLREYIWGDVYSSTKLPNQSDISVQPGYVSMIYPEGGMYVVVITLDRLYNKHEELEILYERKIRNGFLGKNEWVEFTPVTNSQNEIMRVVFPPNRVIQNPTAKYRRGDYSETFGIGQRGFVKKIEEGKEVLEWNIENPVARSSYLIEWEW